MSNREIIQILKLTASLLELYGENQFKVRSYQTAVYNLERTELELSQLGGKQLAEIPGVGKSIATTIEEINLTSASGALDNLLKQTPVGILELLKIKGIGARKIKTAWDQLGIENPKQLLTAASKGTLAELSGFGNKTQARIVQIVNFYLSNKGLIHYRDAHLAGSEFEQQLKQKFPDAQWSRTGAFRRKLEVLKGLQYVWATNSVGDVMLFLDGLEKLKKDLKLSGPLRWRGEFIENSIKLDIRICRPSEFGSRLVYYTGNIRHLLLTNDEGNSLTEILDQPAAEEKTVYINLGWPVIIPELREGMYEKEYLQGKEMDEILQTGDLKGILHNHSTYSDGKNSLTQMAEACSNLGYQYLGISDHSQIAVYANGLDEDRVAEQHREIDLINTELAPFRIFKGIESDILNDGALDYPDPVLQSFDFVVSSIHSNINMDIDQATKRLIKAIENPYTTILGHPTGRQLLRREGYPINHEKVIDACAENNVIMEINAHPLRLDLDWRWIRYAVEKGVRLSINPDAHEKKGLEDVEYGVCVARKAGLTREMTFNTMDLQQMEVYLTTRKNRISTPSTA